MKKVINQNPRHYIAFCDNGHEDTRVYFDGITETGCCIKDAMVLLPKEDYTMGQLVKAIKDAGYKMFKLDTMKIFVEVK